MLPGFESVGSFGDELHNVLLRFLSEPDGFSPGLLTLAFPTGSGKSYAVEQTIASLLTRSVTDEQTSDSTSSVHKVEPPLIIFATPQIKNIPEATKIRRMCADRGLILGEHDVMRLYSETEMLAHTARPDLIDSIPQHFRANMHVEQLIYLTNALKGSEQYEEAIREPLLEFKKDIRSCLRAEAQKDDEYQPITISDIRDNDYWHWLGELWPAVYTKEAKVLLMTTSKLFYNHDTLLDSPIAIDRADWAKGSLVFLDEFDSVKKDSLKAIVNEAADARADLPKLVRSLYHSVSLETLPRYLSSFYDSISLEKKIVRRVERLVDILDELNEKIQLDYLYKADQGVIKSLGLFMYDGSRQTTNIGKQFYAYTDRDRKQNVIVSNYDKNRQPRTLAADAGKMRGAITYAELLIAEVVKDITIDSRRTLRPTIDPRLARRPDSTSIIKRDDLIRSCLEAFGINDPDGRRLMLNDIKNIVCKGTYGHSTYVSGPSFYEQNFGLLAVEDSDSHAFSTHIYAYTMASSPEVRLRDFMEESLVIGLSATAMIDSPLCNYDLQWLREQRPDLIKCLPKSDVRLLEEAHERHTVGYKNMELSVIPIKIKSSVDDSCYFEAKSLVNRTALVDKVINLFGEASAIGSAKNNAYAIRRYTKVGKAFRYFLENISQGVFVCTTSISPSNKAPGESSFRIDTLRSLFRLIMRDVKAAETGTLIRFVDNSVDFQNKYDAMVSELSAESPRMFICAAYGSLATGVNLQYPNFGMKTVQSSPYVFDDKVDLVGVYLDRVTNVAPSSNRISEQSHAADLLTNAFELREMAWRGDLSVDQMDTGIRQLLANSDIPIKMVDKSCVKAASTQIIAQMVGRMCRTANKAPHIHILYDFDLVDTVDPLAMSNVLRSVETTRLLENIDEYAGIMPSSSGPLERMIASRALSTAGWLAGKTKRRFWSSADISSWDELRNDCLRHPRPTSDELAGSVFASCYVRVSSSVNAYRFWERGDFSDIGISFDENDSIDYPHEVSAKAARLDILAKVPGVSGFFESNGWPIEWEPNELMMNPALFRNVYLGTIGEQVGKYIVERYIPNLRLDPIVDGYKFEKFDFVVSHSDVYLDFKHWRSPDFSGEAYFEKIRKKMAAVGATHAIVVNLVRDDNFRDKLCEVDEGPILTVPYLIDDKTSDVAYENIRTLQSWLMTIGVLP